MQYFGGATRMIRRLCLMALIAHAFVAYTVKAEATSTKKSDVLPASNSRFINLFNGRNLAGWKGLKGYWSVKNGSIRGRENKESSRQTFLVLNSLKPTNFELRFKYRFFSREGNSGLQFRSQVLDPRIYVVGGYQADFDANAQFDGSLYDEAGVAGGRETISNRGEKTIWDAESRRHAEPLSVSDVELRSFIRSGQWNDVVLVADGPHIVYSINGHVMTDLIDDSPTALKDGILALQLHKGFSMDVRFKDLKIKLLD
jgi:hypothetical protein